MIDSLDALAIKLGAMPRAWRVHHDAIDGRTFACRNESCWACPSTSDEWCTCGCVCHEEKK